MIENEERAAKSSRHKGAVGSGPTAVTQLLIKTYAPHVGTVLDFGAGRVPRQTEILQAKGYDVFAHEVKANRTDQHITAEMFNFMSWEIVMLSNVINVSTSITGAARLILSALLHANTAVIFNLPDDPVYWKAGSSRETRR